MHSMLRQNQIRLQDVKPYVRSFNRHDPSGPDEWANAEGALFDPGIVVFLLEPAKRPPGLSSFSKTQGDVPSTETFRVKDLCVVVDRVEDKSWVLNITPSAYEHRFLEQLFREKAKKSILDGLDFNYVAARPRIPLTEDKLKELRQLSEIYSKAGSRRTIAQDGSAPDEPARAMLAFLGVDLSQGGTKPVIEIGSVCHMIFAPESVQENPMQSVVKQQFIPILATDRLIPGQTKAAPAPEAQPAPAAEPAPVAPAASPGTPMIYTAEEVAPPYVEPQSPSRGQPMIYTQEEPSIFAELGSVPAPQAQAPQQAPPQEGSPWAPPAAATTASAPAPGALPAVNVPPLPSPDLFQPVKAEAAVEQQAPTAPVAPVPTPAMSAPVAPTSGAANPAPLAPPGGNIEPVLDLELNMPSILTGEHPVIAIDAHLMPKEENGEVAQFTEPPLPAWYLTTHDLEEMNKEALRLQKVLGELPEGLDRLDVELSYDQLPPVELPLTTPARDASPFAEIEDAKQEPAKVDYAAQFKQDLAELEQGLAAPAAPKSTAEQDLRNLFSTPLEEDGPNFIDAIFDESGARGSLEYNPDAAPSIQADPTPSSSAPAPTPVAQSQKPQQVEWQPLDVSAPIDGAAAKQAASTLAHMVESPNSLLASLESSAPVTQSEQPSASPFGSALFDNQSQPSPFAVADTSAKSPATSESGGGATLFQRLGGLRSAEEPEPASDSSAGGKPTNLKDMLTADSNVFTTSKGGKMASALDMSDFDMEEPEGITSDSTPQIETMDEDEDIASGLQELISSTVQSESPADAEPVSPYVPPPKYHAQEQTQDLDIVIPSELELRLSESGETEPVSASDRTHALFDSNAFSTSTSPAPEWDASTVSSDAAPEPWLNLATSKKSGEPTTATAAPATASSTPWTPSAPMTGIASVSQTPAVGTPSTEQAPAVGIASGSQTPAVGTPSTTQAPAVGIASDSQTPAVGTPSTTQAPAVGIASGSQTLAVGTPSTTQAPAVGIASGSQAPAVGTPSTTQAPAVGVASGSQTPAVGTPSTTQAPAVGVSSGSQTPAVETPSTTQAPAVGVASGSQTPAVETPSTTQAPAVGVSSSSQTPILGTPAIPSPVEAPADTFFADDLLEEALDEVEAAMSEHGIPVADLAEEPAGIFAEEPVPTYADEEEPVPTSAFEAEPTSVYDEETVAEYEEEFDTTVGISSVETPVFELPTEAPAEEAAAALPVAAADVVTPLQRPVPSVEMPPVTVPEPVAEVLAYEPPLAVPATEVPPVSATPSTQLPPVSATPSTQLPPVSATPSTQQPPVSATPSTQLPPVSATPSTQLPPVSATPSTQLPPVSATPSTQLPPVSATASGAAQPVASSTQGTRSLDIPPLPDPYASAASATTSQETSPVSLDAAQAFAAQQAAAQAAAQAALQATSPATSTETAPIAGTALPPQVAAQAEPEFNTAEPTTSSFFEEPAAATPARPKQPAVEPKLVISESTRFMAKLNQRLSEADKKLSSRTEQIKDRLNRELAALIDETTREERQNEASISSLTSKLTKHLENVSSEVRGRIEDASIQSSENFRQLITDSQTETQRLHTTLVSELTSTVERFNSDCQDLNEQAKQRLLQHIQKSIADFNTQIEKICSNLDDAHEQYADKVVERFERFKGRINDEVKSILNSLDRNVDSMTEEIDGSWERASEKLKVDRSEFEQTIAHMVRECEFTIKNETRRAYTDQVLPRLFDNKAIFKTMLSDMKGNFEEQSELIVKDQVTGLETSITTSRTELNKLIKDCIDNIDSVGHGQQSGLEDLFSGTKLRLEEFTRAVELKLASAKFEIIDNDEACTQLSESLKIEDEPEFMREKHAGVTTLSESRASADNQLETTISTKCLDLEQLSDVLQEDLAKQRADWTSAVKLTAEDGVTRIKKAIQDAFNAIENAKDQYME